MNQGWKDTIGLYFMYSMIVYMAVGLVDLYQIFHAVDGMIVVYYNIYGEWLSEKILLSTAMPGFLACIILFFRHLMNEGMS